MPDHLNWREMTSFHDHRSFHAYLLPGARSILQCIPLGTHVFQRYSGEQMKISKQNDQGNKEAL